MPFGGEQRLQVAGVGVALDEGFGDVGELATVQPEAATVTPARAMAKACCRLVVCGLMDPPGLLE